MLEKSKIFQKSFYKIEFFQKILKYSNNFSLPQWVWAGTATGTSFLTGILYFSVSWDNALERLFTTHVPLPAMALNMCIKLVWNK